MSAATVCIVDDDPSFLKSLSRLIGTAGYRVRTFDRAAAFLDARMPKGPKCLLLDLRMPGLGGLAVQRELAARGLVLPVIFLTGHGDVPASVDAMKAGALDFLTKPVKGAVLLAAVRAAVEKDKARLRDQRAVDDIRSRVATLSPRELEVLRWIVSGLINKQAAFEMGISEKTVKFHRAMVMRKMKAQSVAALALLADRAGVPPMRKAGSGTG